MFDYEQDLQTINLNKVKFLLMARIERLLLENGAIIFGGYVRDKLIHDHHATLFYQQNRLKGKKYSDPSFHPETKHRLLIPKDIDVFIRGTQQEVDEIYSKLTDQGFRVEVKHRKKIYGVFDDINQQKVVVYALQQLGFPSIKIELDVLYSSKPDVKPPFGRLDLWCNGLLLDKNGITLSNQTGSCLDRANGVDRKLFEIEIINDLLKFRSKSVRKETLDSEDQEETCGPQTKNKMVLMNGVFCPVITEDLISKRITSMKQRGWTIIDDCT
jgi:hypothetical protein